MTEELSGYWKWEREIYPKIWHEAFDLGVKSKEQGLSNVCNLTDKKFVHNEKILKVYESAWNQGYDHNFPKAYW